MKKELKITDLREVKRISIERVKEYPIGQERLKICDYIEKLTLKIRKGQIYVRY